ncbi:hypothetical protein N7474_006041 [Penicillium riverlandense]|uniref:uncharacterized protein n=1 Tax=Penicillium riverlandense TaxID=1903569 RepID=UPI0025496841|nr:uncharacterized protein N7474_006041 [Penicillium riverlandense]KAJ5820450.1 hypothetical protein N7474_006041 [Penicillium riverlandense]
MLLGFWDSLIVPCIMGISAHTTNHVQLENDSADCQLLGSNCRNRARFDLPFIAGSFPLSFTNERECVTALNVSKLGFVQLETHTATAKQSLLKLSQLAARFRSFRCSALFYIAAFVTYTTITWILSTIFVVDVVTVGRDLSTFGNNSLSPNQYSFTDIRLGVGIQDDDDACLASVTAANCTYSLALGPLSSLLIAREPYQIAGFTFRDGDPFGTHGIPYDALYQFWNDPELSRWGDLTTQYCLPMLDPNTVSCRQDVSNSRVNYRYVGIEGSNGLEIVTVDPNTTFATAFPHAARNNGTTGTMTVAQSNHSGPPYETVISGSYEWADLLSRLSYGTNSTSNIFTTVCTLENRGNWRWVTLSYSDNTFTASLDLATELCSNDPSVDGYQYNTVDRVAAYKILPFAIEGPTYLLSSTDGYSKFINQDDHVYLPEDGGKTLTQYYAQLNNMTELETLLSGMYATVQTIYTSTQNGTAATFPILKVTSPHQYQVTINWTVISALSAAAATLIWIFTVAQAVRWIVAIFHDKKLGWALMEPLELMGYASHIAQDLKSLQVHSEGKLKLDKLKGIRLGPEGVLNLDGEDAVDLDATRSANQGSLELTAL